MKRTTWLLLAFLLLAGKGWSQEDMNIQMAFVKGGNFFMGSDDHKFLDAEYDNERPLHRVNVSSFYLGKYEVTLDSGGR